MKILYCGDSSPDGPARYLLCILKHLKAEVVHVPPGKKLAPSLLREHFNGIILSDFSHQDLPAVSERLLCSRVWHGTGLLMIGGWGSFSGPFGKWKGSAVERLLPVRCLDGDDRLNFSSGAPLILENRHPIFKGLSWDQPPVICGINKVILQKNARVVLSVRKMLIRSGKVELEKKRYPLFILDPSPSRRIAALTTDLAPHWCGGLVDWGENRRKLRLNNSIAIEVGSAYLQFVSLLVRWVAGS